MNEQISAIMYVLLTLVILPKPRSSVNTWSTVESMSQEPLHHPQGCTKPCETTKLLFRLRGVEWPRGHCPEPRMGSERGLHKAPWQRNLVRQCRASLGVRVNWYPGSCREEGACRMDPRNHQHMHRRGPQERAEHVPGSLSATVSWGNGLC